MNKKQQTNNRNVILMKEIRTGDFAKYAIDHKNSIFYETWDNSEGKMTVDEFKEIMLLHSSIIEKNGLENILVYAQNMNFLITPELQDWINAEYFQVPGKAAFVMPSDLFERISIQQTMDDNELVRANRDAVRYFDNKEEALTYILD